VRDIEGWLPPSRVVSWKHFLDLLGEIFAANLLADKVRAEIMARMKTTAAADLVGQNVPEDRIAVTLV
jgi:hypothetical protein